LCRRDCAGHDAAGRDADQERGPTVAGEGGGRQEARHQGSSAEEVGSESHVEGRRLEVPGPPDQRLRLARLHGSGNEERAAEVEAVDAAEATEEASAQEASVAQESDPAAAPDMQTRASQDIPDAGEGEANPSAAGSDTDEEPDPTPPAKPWWNPTGGGSDEPH